MSIDTLEPPAQHIERPLEEVETVTIRFAGDSGDGMQLTGTQFTNTSAIVGNDISTLPDFPAEIRAPAGSLPGVSGFQLNFSNQDIRTPDFPQPVGIFRVIERPTYEDMLKAQIENAVSKRGTGDLEKLIYTGDMWTVE